MTMFMLSWCENPAIIRMHKIRLFCHMGLAFMSVLMLSSTSVILAYSIRMYHGSFLHSVAEILAASAVSFIIVGLAWLPSNEHLGSYGIPIMRTVWQELVWSGLLTLGIGASLASLHESTPGLMTSCGRYFICRGYIFIFIATWLGWATIAIPTFLLLASALYQMKRSPLGGTVWQVEVDRFEYFWFGQTHLKSRRVTTIGELPRVEPDLNDLKNHNHNGLYSEDEKRASGYRNY
ncbi:hypothetical protein MJO28_010698 [Puccinia striiformis f. sp. tritici]|nr:hypothetical protein Pst134EA_019506 [Puccinia striiformis f. sp. tritici]KAI9610613.1 hypothetical protein H4Q26_006759 [Puccinia striiformis f. sp. tritici PST-130]KNF05269.1 hypothetical protein PSTG_01483 [Puccinia striiformis f. sp. tritici PST-78]POV99128.1 hypothetical protein PSTT_14018 [Puccinia striiformis]KAH9449574.1 hypothetical protein Pst134EB_020394 [Puccinia striiformis f. sp. tritici]KAH9459354.1 hypothetical protein Pst134EA_019506 [Puccinia striiformis f. sp. tritici]